MFRIAGVNQKCNWKVIGIPITFLLVFLTLSGCSSEDNQAKRPNILFAISDDQSFAHTSFAGCSFVNTSAFDRVAGEGIHFTNCYAGSPGCAPSRGSIVTGRYHWQNEQSGQHASSWMKKYVPFIDLLNQNGYMTGKTGKGVNPFQYARDENDSLWRKGDAAGNSFSSIKYEEGSAEDERFGSGISENNYFEDFKYFVDQVAKEKPFFFWYGAHEPHRQYEKDSWKRMGKKLEDVRVPGFFPDNDVIRGDMLDYAVEIEWFDLHLLRMLEYLEEIGELENTIVIVTSDNGMPFPRGKANCYEYGVHVPFAVRYPKAFPGGRIVEDPVCFADLAPTILELTGTSPAGMMPISGKSMVNLLTSRKEGVVNDAKKYVFAGRERHSCSRYLNWGYPQRVIRSKDFLYIWNLKPDRWPSGDPQLRKSETSDERYPMYGLDENGKLGPGAGFTDIDGSPTKTFFIENHNDETVKPFFDLSMAKRPEVELFDVVADPFCLNNLAGTEDYVKIETEMKEALMDELIKSKDPRVVGPDKEIFDSYIRYSPMRYFPKPEN